MYFKSVPKINSKRYYPMGNHAVIISFKIYVFLDTKQPIYEEKSKREITMLYFDVDQNAWFSGSVLKLQNDEQFICANMLINQTLIITRSKNNFEVKNLSYFILCVL